jgi:multidrug resistance efflux pump
VDRDRLAQAQDSFDAAEAALKRSNEAVDQARAELEKAGRTPVRVPLGGVGRVRLRFRCGGCWAAW